MGYLCTVLKKFLHINNYTLDQQQSECTAVSQTEISEGYPVLALEQICNGGTGLK